MSSRSWTSRRLMSSTSWRRNTKMWETTWSGSTRRTRMSWETCMRRRSKGSLTRYRRKSMRLKMQRTASNALARRERQRLPAWSMIMDLCVTSSRTTTTATELALKILLPTMIRNSRSNARRTLKDRPTCEATMKRTSPFCRQW
jgi:hypothetical protein